MAHSAAIQRWLSGDWHGAAARSTPCSSNGPTTSSALLVGHQLDFFRGDAANLRDRVARSIGRHRSCEPLFGFVQGMFAFGLEESGDYQAAERHGLAAVAAHPEDVWAIHAVTHVYEMQGRVDEGISFLRSRQADWGSGNMFTVHNWWHLALYLLEADRVDDALDLYDARSTTRSPRASRSRCSMPARCCGGCSSKGEDTGGRFGPLADAWATRSGACPGMPSTTFTR